MCTHIPQYAAEHFAGWEVRRKQNLSTKLIFWELKEDKRRIWIPFWFSWELFSLGMCWFNHLKQNYLMVFPRILIGLKRKKKLFWSSLWCILCLPPVWSQSLVQLDVGGLNQLQVLQTTWMDLFWPFTLQKEKQNTSTMSTYKPTYSVCVCVCSVLYVQHALAVQFKLNGMKWLICSLSSTF